MNSNRTSNPVPSEPNSGDFPQLWAKLKRRPPAGSLVFGFRQWWRWQSGQGLVLLLFFVCCFMAALSQSQWIGDKWPTGWAEQGPHWMSVTLSAGVMWLVVWAGLWWLGWRRFQRRLLSGAVGLAKVVGHQPLTLAVLTDLSKGSSQTPEGTPATYPAIAVVRLRRNNMGWRTLKYGDYLPVAVVHTPCNVQACGRYHGLQAYPLEPFAANQQQQLAVLSRFNKQDFRMLDACLSDLPSPLKPTYYKVMRRSDWTFDQLISTH